MRPNAVIVCVLLLAASAQAVEPAVLTDDRLQEHKIQFLGYADGKVRFFDEDRNLTTLEESKVVRVKFIRRAPGIDTPALRLADGAEIYGRFDGVTEKGEVRWKSNSLGTIEVPLENVHSFTTGKSPLHPKGVTFHSPGRSPGYTAHLMNQALKGRNNYFPSLAVTLFQGCTNHQAQPADADVVALSNGDSLTGFVDALTPQSLKLKQGDENLDLPWNNIAEVSLANPVRHKPGVWLKLVDGSSVRAETLELLERQLTGTTLGKRMEITTTDVWAVEFTQNKRLIPLHEIPSKVTAGGSAFGVEFPPGFGLRVTADLHAPVTLQFELPTGAKRFAASAHLLREDLDQADMVLIISDGKGELLRQRIHAKQSELPINLELRDTTLTIRLDEGVNGPIRDRLILDNPAVLVEGLK